MYFSAVMLSIWWLKCKLQCHFSDWNFPFTSILASITVKIFRAVENERERVTEKGDYGFHWWPSRKPCNVCRTWPVVDPWGVLQVHNVGFPVKSRRMFAPRENHRFMKTLKEYRKLSLLQWLFYPLFSIFEPISLSLSLSRSLSESRVVFPSFGQSATRAVPICQRSHLLATQSSHFVILDRAGWQAKLASIEFHVPWRNGHAPPSPPPPHSAARVKMQQMTILF